MKKIARPSYDNLSFLLKGKGFNANNLARILPHSRNTIQRRLRSPEEITIGDIFLIAKTGQISLNEIFEALRKDMG